MMDNLDIIISAAIAIVVVLIGLPGLWQQTINELGNGPFRYPVRESIPRRIATWLRRVVRKLRQRWHTDMAFYDYWLRLRHSRKEAWQAAQSVLG